MKKMRISFFGHFGQGNLGNEATLQAILHNFRKYLPSAEMNCICSCPEIAEKIHNIPAIPMKPIFAQQRFDRHFSKATRFMRKMFIGIPSEVCRWLRAFKTLSRTDMLVIPGTQFLSDNLTGPFSWPYLAFQWSVVAKMLGCKLCFVSVGIGPLNHPLSKLFVKLALWIADFRSYRDECSKQYMNSIGFDSKNDSVFPDLAFSLPMSGIHTIQNERLEPIIAVGLLDYHGQFGSHSLRDNAQEVYCEYLDKTCNFVSWLLRHRYTVRLVIGDVSYDPRVSRDLKDLLLAKGVKYESHQLVYDPVESVEELIAQLHMCDVVVTPRFHNVILSLLLAKPVIALSYHEKFSALMEGDTLTKLNFNIDKLNVEHLLERFLDVEEKKEELTLLLSRKVEVWRKSLDEQYKHIFMTCNFHNRREVNCDGTF
jgi:polysaccharide pyruvyl transferase WcaK-like protein